MHKKKIIFYKQTRANDCGLACLKMIMAYSGKDISPNKLLVKSIRGDELISIFDLSRIAENIGLKTQALRANLEALISEIQLPCILYWNRNHFVILYKITKKNFFIVDPASGFLKFSTDEFKSQWLIQQLDKNSLGILLEFDLDSNGPRKNKTFNLT